MSLPSIYRQTIHTREVPNSLIVSRLTVVPKYAIYFLFDFKIHCTACSDFDTHSGSGLAPSSPDELSIKELVEAKGDASWLTALVRLGCSRCPRLPRQPFPSAACHSRQRNGLLGGCTAPGVGREVRWDSQVTEIAALVAARRATQLPGSHSKPLCTPRVRRSVALVVADVLPHRPEERGSSCRAWSTGVGVSASARRRRCSLCCCWRGLRRCARRRCALCGVFARPTAVCLRGSQTRETTVDAGRPSRGPPSRGSTPRTRRRPWDRQRRRVVCAAHPPPARPPPRASASPSTARVRPTRVAVQTRR